MVLDHNTNVPQSNNNLSDMEINTLFKIVFLVTLVLSTSGCSLILFQNLLLFFFCYQNNPCSCMLIFVVVVAVLGADVEKSSETLVSDAGSSGKTVYPYNRRCLRRIDCFDFCPRLTIPLCLDRYCRCIYP